MNRANRVLLALLIAQLLFFGLAVSFCGRDQGPSTARVLLLAGTDRASVSAIRIEDGDGQAIQLARGPAGWSLPDRAGYPVDTDKLDRLLGNLLGLESVYLVARTQTHHRDLEVADAKFRRKVQVSTAAGGRTLVVGSTGPGGYTHVRLEPAPEVYAVDGLNPWKLGTRVYDWAKLAYFEVEQDRIATIEVQRGGSTMRIERSSLDAWQVDGQPVADKDKLDRLVEDLAKLELSDVAGKSSDPEALAKIEQSKDLVRVTVSLANRPLPISRDFAQPVPPPEPLTPGSAEEQQASAPAPATPLPAPEIAETRLLRFASHPDKQHAALLLAEGSSHVVEIDRWRIQDLLEADPGKLLGE